MHLTKVESLLNNHGHKIPDLDIFVKENGALNIAEWQPYGHLSYSEYYGFRCDNEHADKARRFVEHIVKNNQSLALTPEYSFPYQVLSEIIGSEKLWPNEGKLWCLGMEGISYRDYKEYYKQIIDDEHLIAIESRPKITEKYCNVLIYIFRICDKLVLIPQYKTQPARDAFNTIEGSNMCIGEEIVTFCNTDESKLFASLICADVLSTGIDLLNEKYPYAETLLFIPQLNPASMHDSFTECIKKTLNFTSRARLLMLNWAENTENIDAKITFRIRHGLSAFVKSDPYYDTNEVHIRKNHLKGMSYCTYEHLSIWYSTRKECILDFCILPFRYDRQYAILRNNYEPTITQIITYADKQAPGLVSCLCTIDWDWMNRAFGVTSCFSSDDGCRENQCKYINITSFVNSFFYDSVFAARGITDDNFYSPAANIPKQIDGSEDEWVEKKREKFTYIFSLLDEECFPKRFSNFKNNHEWELEKPGVNIATKTRRKNGINEALFIFIDVQSNALKVISKINAKYGPECVKRLLLCYATNKGYRYYQDSLDVNITNGSGIVVNCNANNRN